jgi:hypothetical protein
MKRLDFMLGATHETNLPALRETLSGEARVAGVLLGEVQERASLRIAPASNGAIPKKPAQPKKPSRSPRSGVTPSFFLGKGDVY